MVLTKQLLLGLLSFRFMLLLLFGRFLRVVNLDTKIRVSIIIRIIVSIFYYFHFLLLLLLLLVLFTLVVGSWFSHVQDHCNFTTSAAGLSLTGNCLLISCCVFVIGNMFSLLLIHC